MKTFEAAPEEAEQQQQPSQLAPITYEAADDGASTLPDYANGHEPSKAIPKSPLNSSERFKLFALGNKQGQLKELSKMFPEGVELDSDGNFKVQKDGLWYEMDPRLETPDSWASTAKAAKSVAKAGAAIFAGTVVGAADLVDMIQGKFTGKDFIPDPQKIVSAITSDDAMAEELTGEVAENVDIAASLAMPGAGVAATVGKTLATAAATAGATKILTSSLGRLEGTYEADLDQQQMDIAKDMLFAAGGTMLGLGVKPTVEWFAKTGVVKKIGETLNQIPEESRQALTRAITAPFKKAAEIGRTAQGIGADDLANMVDDAPGVQRILNKAALSSTQDKGSVIVRSANEAMRKLADAGDEALKETWQIGQRELAEAIPSNIEIGAKAATDDVLDWMMDNGLLKLKSGVNPNRVAVLKEAGRDISRFYDLLDQNAAFTRAAKADFKTSDVAFSDEAWTSLNSMWPKLQGIRQSPATRGKEGVSAAIEATKIIRSMTNAARLAGAKEGDDVLMRFATSVGELQKKGMAQKLQQAPAAAKAYSDMIERYSAVSDMVEPLKKAMRSENPEAMTNLFNQFSARAGRNEIGVKAPLQDLVKLTNERGYTSASKLADAYREIKAHKTAGVLSNITGQRNFWGGGAGGLAATSFLTGNPGIGAAIVGQHVARHPMTTFNAVRLGQASLATMRWMNQQTLIKALRDPRAAYALTNSWLDAEEAEQQTKEMLLQQVQPQ